LDLVKQDQSDAGGNRRQGGRLERVLERPDRPRLPSAEPGEGDEAKVDGVGEREKEEGLRHGDRFADPPRLHGVQERDADQKAAGQPALEGVEFPQPAAFLTLRRCLSHPMVPHVATPLVGGRQRSVGRP
jgi:hypothetical protein